LRKKRARIARRSAQRVRPERNQSEKLNLRENRCCLARTKGKTRGRRSRDYAKFHVSAKGGLEGRASSEQLKRRN